MGISYSLTTLTVYQIPALESMGVGRNIRFYFGFIIVNTGEVITIMRRNNRPKLQKEGSEYVEDPRNTEHWKMFEWVWDKLCMCPYIDNVSDVDFRSGDMGIISKDGDEYTITLKKKKWREL